MSEFFLQKTKTGWLPPHETDIAESRKLDFGTQVKVNYKKSRNPGNHRRYFAMLQLVLENAIRPDGSDMFKNIDETRFYMMIKTGNVEHLFIDSVYIIKPKSIAFDEMPEDEFRELFSKSIDVALKDCIPGTDRGEFEQQILAFAG